MKTGCIKFFDKLLVFLLSATGLIVGCQKDDPMDEYGAPMVEYGTMVAYGTPSALYEIRGTVTDATTKKPIRNIQVVLPLFKNTPEAEGDTVYTDIDGTYKFDRYFLSSDYQLKFEDIDGEENGTYGYLTVEGEFTEQDQVEPGDGDWYRGKYVKTHNVTLDAPLAIPMYGVPSAPFNP